MLTLPFLLFHDFNIAQNFIKNENKKIILMAIIGLFVIVSCKRDLPTEPEKQENLNFYSTPIPPVTSSGGILEFSSSCVMDSVLKELDSMSSSAIQVWEFSYSFTSMRTIYNDVADAENALADSMELVGDTSDLSGTIKHSNLAIQNSSVLIERTIPASEGGGGFYEKNIRFEPLSWVVDKRGLVIIGDTLYHFSYDTVKYLLNGTGGDANLLLSATVTDSLSGIFVEPIGEYGFMRKVTTNPFQIDCRNTNSRNRVYTYHQFFQSKFFSAHTRTTYKITAKGFKRRFFGLWWDSKHMFLELSWEVVGNKTHEGLYFTSPPPSNPVFNLDMSCSDSRSKGSRRELEFYLPTGSPTPVSHYTNNIANFQSVPEVYSANITGKACDGGCAQCTSTR